MEGIGNYGAGFFAGSDQRAAIRNPGQQGGDVGGGNYLQESVGGVVFQAADLAGGVVEGQAFIGTESSDGGFVKPFIGLDAEVIFVPEVDEAHYPPEIVDPVRVVERHAPTMRLRRETAQKQHPRPLRQERLKWVWLYVHCPNILILPYACNMFRLSSPFGWRLSD